MKRYKKILSLLLIWSLMIGNSINVNAATSLSSEKIATYFNGKVGKSYPSGMCLAFVADCFQNMGASRSSTCCAYNYGNSYIDSTSLQNIPIGADVFFGNCGGGPCKSCGASYYGHIGVYVGDGYFVHATGGKVQKSTMSSWSSKYRGWGYHGNINVVNNSNISPTAPSISKNQYWYDLKDTIKITAYADGANRYYMSMFKDEERIKGESVPDGKFTMAASDFGIGDYSVYFSCSNSAGTVDTEWLTFSVVGEPGYSDVWTSKAIYDLEDEVSISVSPICSKGQVIGIDKNGVERVITGECDSTYTIPASKLGVGQYSAYFTVYNGSGTIDTKRVEFAIVEPSNLGNQFYAQIKNPSTNMYVSNIKGNVEGKPMDCDHSRIWRFERQGDGTYKIISSLDEAAMDVTDYGSAGNGTNIQMKTSWDTTAQKFYIYEVYGAYYIKPICCDLYLDMDQNEPNNLAAWGGGADWPAQKFEIIKIHSDDVGVHKYVSSVEKEATCTKEGVRKYTCSVCQDSYTESIKKTEHQYSNEWTIDVEATYTVEGSKSRHCINCDAKTDVIVIPKLEEDTDSETEVGMLSLESVQGKPGETVAVPIKIEKNPGIIAIQCKLQYDSSKIKLVNVEGADMLDDSALSTDYTKNPYILSFGDELATENITAAGILATAYFKILPEFKEGKAKIEVIFEEAYDKDLNEVTFESCSGEIEAKQYIPGDVNGDGQVKLNDAILLRRYVAGWDVVIDSSAGDVNGDGQVKLNDAILLRRYVAGWDVTLK